MYSRFGLFSVASTRRHRGVRTRMIALIGCLAAMLVFAPAAQAADPFFGLFSTDMSDPPAQLASDVGAHAATGVGVVREHLSGIASSAPPASSTSGTPTR